MNGMNLPITKNPRGYSYTALSAVASIPRRHDGVGQCSVSALSPPYSTTAFPAAVPHPDGNVVGEVITFEEDPDEWWRDALEHMDEYEGVPHLYYRDLITVKMAEGEEVTAWVYLYTDEDAVKALDLIYSGDWAEWTSTARSASVMF